MLSYWQYNTCCHKKSAQLKFSAPFHEKLIPYISPFMSVQNKGLRVQAESLSSQNFCFSIEPASLKKKHMEIKKSVKILDINL